MDGSTIDNKLNMSLDDIIKKERKAKQRQQDSGMQGAARKRVVAKRVNRGKRPITVRSIARRNRQQSAVNGGLSAAAAMKVVNRLVKKAIRRRANQSLISRAVTLRRRAIRRNSAVRPAMRGLRARRQAALVGSRLMGRLSGVSQRSRVIRGNTGRGMRRQPVIFTSSQMVRGRGLSHMGQLASDSEAFMVEQREIARPVLQQKVLHRDVVAAQPRREVIMQRRARPVMVGQQPIIVRRGGIRKRAILNESDVVVVRNTPRQVQFRTQPEFGRVQRVVNVRPHNRLIRRTQYVVNPNAAQMRKALGIGLRRSEPQRFESSSTFLQRIPVANRRGRGFQDVLYS
uniref:Forty-two-three domain-containing protein 1 n=1 Tax=Elaeophora elaphi TaxID=1147741 RepID=A0A0R3RYL2_9BILA